MNINEWVNGQSRDADNTTLGKQDTKQTTQHWANKTQNKQHNTGQTRHKTTTQHWANKTQNKQHARCEFESRSGEVHSIQHYVIKSDLRPAGGFIRVF
jgi:hypothetical protein